MSPMHTTDVANQTATILDGLAEIIGTEGCGAAWNTVMCTLVLFPIGVP